MDLTVRVSVGVAYGERQHVHVFFVSNDPARPCGNLEVIVTRAIGGMYAVPAAIVFGTLSVDATARCITNLYDVGVRGRRVEKVRSSHPERFEVRLVELKKEQLDHVHGSAGDRIARLEVIALTQNPGPLDGHIEVSFAGEARRVDRIPVMGKVTSGVECWPGSLVLPRMSQQGTLYSGEVLVSQATGRPISITLDQVPEGLLVHTVPLRGRVDRLILHVECESVDTMTDQDHVESVICFRVHSDGAMTKIQLPVFFMRSRS